MYPGNTPRTLDQQSGNMVAEFHARMAIDAQNAGNIIVAIQTFWPVPMHFRVRKNVIQMIRVTYDAGKKKGVNTVVGTIRLANPELSAELRKTLTPEELDEFNTWLNTRHRLDTLHDEFAALSLAESMVNAERWFEREGDSQIARMAASDIYFQWQALRKILTKNGLLD